MLASSYIWVEKIKGMEELPHGDKGLGLFSLEMLGSSALQNQESGEGECRPLLHQILQF